MPNWSQFDDAARSASRAIRAHREYIRAQDDLYGTSSDFRRLSSGSHEVWDYPAKTRCRELCHAANDAQDHALKLRPRYTRNVTALRRLRSIIGD